MIWWLGRAALTLTGAGLAAHEGEKMVTGSNDTIVSRGVKSAFTPSASEQPPVDQSIVDRGLQTVTGLDPAKIITRDPDRPSLLNSFLGSSIGEKAVTAAGTAGFLGLLFKSKTFRQVAMYAAMAFAVYKLGKMALDQTGVFNQEALPQDGVSEDFDRGGPDAHMPEELDFVGS